MQIEDLMEKVEEQAEELRDKEKRIRSYAKRTVDLERQLQEQQMDPGMKVEAHALQLLLVQLCQSQGLSGHLRKLSLFSADFRFLHIYITR
jgi:hypothetical protein